MSNPRIPRKPGQPANSKKHSDLYTDENPKGTIHGLGFKDVETAKGSVSKIRNSSRSHAHKIQAAVAMEQRAREMGKTSEAAVYRKFINSMKKKTKKMNEAKNIHGKVEIPQGNIKKLAAKASKRVDSDVDGDVDHNDPKSGKFGEFVPSADGKKRVTTSMKEEKNGRCPVGQYYCYTDKKCKEIPKGFKVVGPMGYLRKENGHSVDEPKNGNGKGNGNGNGNGGNGNGGNGNGGGNGGNGGSMSEEGLRDWFGKSKSKDGKGGWVNVKTGGTCASDEPGEGTPKCVSSAKRASMTKAERDSASRRKKAADPGQQQKSGAAKPTYVSTDPKKKMKKEDMDINEAKDKKGKGSGTKDACYHKVKSRYSVWPSAYASGALVKCRKVGAANWGNSPKNEEYMSLPEFTESQIGAMRYAGIEVEVIDEKCWKGYEKKGMKTMFGKRYPNCVKKEDEIKNDDKLISEKKGCSHTHEGDECPVHGKKECPALEKVSEAMTLKAKVGQVISVHLSWRGRYINIKMFFPQMGLPNRKDIEAEIAKVYPGANVMAYKIDQKQPGEPMVMVGEEEILGKSSEVSEDWQKANKSDKTDGMSKKAVAAYRRENPGSKLKTAVTGKVKAGSKDAKRRKSFCARSKGQQDMHNIDCSKTPDKPVCKARRRWKC